MDNFFNGFGDELIKIAMTRMSKELIRRAPMSRSLSKAMQELHLASGKIPRLAKGKWKGKYDELDRIMKKIEKKMTPEQRRSYELWTE